MAKIDTININQHSSLESLEFSLLEEVSEIMKEKDMVFSQIDCDKAEILERLIRNTITLCKVVGEIKGRYIFNLSKYQNNIISLYTVDNTKTIKSDFFNNLKMGDVFYAIRDSHRNITPLEVDITKKELDKVVNFKEIAQERNYMPYSWLDDGEVAEEKITYKRLIGLIQSNIQKRENEKNDNEKREEKEKEERKETADSNLENYDNGEYFELSIMTSQEVSHKVSKKGILVGVEWNGQEFLFDKDIKDIFSFKEIKDLKVSFETEDKVLSNIETDLIEKGIEYKKIRDGRLRGTYGYKISYEDNSVCVNGVKIPKAKLTSILFSFGDGKVITAEKIKSMIKLTKEQSAILELKTLDFSTQDKNRGIGINISYLGNDWEVSMFGKTVKMDWKTVKDNFVFRKNWNRITTTHLNKIIKTLKVSKKNVFDELKKIDLIKAMGDNQ